MTILILRGRWLTGAGRPVAPNVGGLVVVAVIARAVLWLARSMRDDWNVALRAMRLLAKSLPY